MINVIWNVRTRVKSKPTRGGWPHKHRLQPSFLCNGHGGKLGERRRVVICGVSCSVVWWFRGMQTDGFVIVKFRKRQEMSLRFRAGMKERRKYGMSESSTWSSCLMSLPKPYLWQRRLFHFEVLFIRLPELSRLNASSFQVIRCISQDTTTYVILSFEPTHCVNFSDFTSWIEGWIDWDSL